MPAQNAEPAPVSTMQPTSWSAPSPPKASASSTLRSIESAFRFSGRCRVTRATSSRRSIERSPATARSYRRLRVASGARRRAEEERREVEHGLHDLPYGEAPRADPDHRGGAGGGRREQ